MSNKVFNLFFFLFPPPPPHPLFFSMVPKWFKHSLRSESVNANTHSSCTKLPHRKSGWQDFCISTNCADNKRVFLRFPGTRRLLTKLPLVFCLGLHNRVTLFQRHGNQAHGTPLLRWEGSTFFHWQLFPIILCEATQLFLLELKKNPQVWFLQKTQTTVWIVQVGIKIRKNNWNGLDIMKVLEGAINMEDGREVFRFNSIYLALIRIEWVL